LKILVTFPGHLKTVPMNRYIPESLVRMGHEVVPFSYEAKGLYSILLKKADKARWVEYMDRRLLALVRKTRPDAFLTIYGVDHGIQLIESVKAEGVTTICWWLNDPFQFERSTRMAGSFDFYFTNSDGIIPEYHKRGLHNVHYLPVGVYPPVHRRIPGKRHVYDVSFAGDWSPVREDILTNLAVDFDVTIFGPWKKKLGKGSPLMSRLKGGKFFSPEEMVGIFNRSKVVLNIHSWYGRTDYGINPRVFEANGCGAFQVCDWKQEIPALYEDGKEIVLYKDLPELKDGIAYYLSHEAERAAIADNGYARSHGEHTYEHRLTKMLSVCGFG